jgi:hypothetical protein
MSRALTVSMPSHCALRLAVQDIALSRRKHGFDSRRARQLFQWLSCNNQNDIQQMFNTGLHSNKNPGAHSPGLSQAACHDDSSSLEKSDQ